MRESPVVAACLAYLQSRGDCFAWRNNTGGYSPRPGQFIRFGLPGSGDILGCIGPSGRMLAVECKRPGGGTVSTQQRVFGARLTAAGGLYVIARSVEELAAALPPVTVELPPASGRVYPR